MAETNPFVELFGAQKLSNHSGEPIDPSTLTSKDGVLLYFSAHWCGPCRHFTPELTKYYNEKKGKFNFEIVFVSSDQNQEAFDQYWGEMPWLALSYADRTTKDKLSKKYKVSGIPTLVVLDKTGNTITTDARSKVSSDPDGFPWIPKTFWEILGGTNALAGGEAGGEVPVEGLKSNTAIGIYFSAHWCPPCKSFTPKLVETYKKIKDDGKKFEIIFASSDNDEKQFKDYFGEMPWIALPFQDKRTSELSDLYGVEGIPTLVIVDPATGKTITTKGRASVTEDPNGAEFPWYPKPLISIESGGSELNEGACFIYLDKALSEETKTALNSVATHYSNLWKTENKETPLFFFYGKDGTMATKVHQFVHVPNDPCLLILDIPNGCKYVHTLSGSGTEAEFNNFVKAFLANELTSKWL